MNLFKIIAHYLKGKRIVFPDGYFKFQKNILPILYTYSFLPLNGISVRAQFQNFYYYDIFSKSKKILSSIYYTLFKKGIIRQQFSYLRQQNGIVGRKIKLFLLKYALSLWIKRSNSTSLNFPNMVENSKNVKIISRL